VSLDPLATEDDVETELTRALTSAEAVRVAGLLTQASRLVRRKTRQTFTLATSTDVLRITHSEIRLPQRPVTAVSEVALVGYDGVTTYPVPFVWDGLDMVTLFGEQQVLNLPELLKDYAASTAAVTYTHGYSTIPDDVVGITARMVARVYLAPGTPGVSYQSTGPFSYRVTDGYNPGLVTLAQEDVDALRDGGYIREIRSIGTLR